MLQTSSPFPPFLSAVGINRQICLDHMSRQTFFRILSSFLPTCSSVLLLSKLVDHLGRVAFSSYTSERSHSSSLPSLLLSSSPSQLSFFSPPLFYSSDMTSYAIGRHRAGQLSLPSSLFHLLLETEGEEEDMQEHQRRKSSKEEEEDREVQSRGVPMTGLPSSFSSSPPFLTSSSALTREKSREGEAGMSSFLWSACVYGLQYALSLCLLQWRSMLATLQKAHLHALHAELGLHTLSSSSSFLSHENEERRRKEEEEERMCSAGPLPEIPSLSSSSFRPITLLYLMHALHIHQRCWVSIATVVNTALSQSQLFLSSSSLSFSSCDSPSFYLLLSLIALQLEALQSAETAGDENLQRVWRCFLYHTCRPFLLILDRWMVYGATLGYPPDIQSFLHHLPFSSLLKSLTPSSSPPLLSLLHSSSSSFSRAIQPTGIDRRSLVQHLLTSMALERERDERRRNRQEKEEEEKDSKRGSRSSSGRGCLRDKKEASSNEEGFSRQNCLSRSSAPFFSSPALRVQGFLLDFVQACKETGKSMELLKHLRLENFRSSTDGCFPYDPRRRHEEERGEEEEEPEEERIDEKKQKKKKREKERRDLRWVEKIEVRKEDKTRRRRRLASFFSQDVDSSTGCSEISLQEGGGEEDQEEEEEEEFSFWEEVRVVHEENEEEEEREMEVTLGGAATFFLSRMKEKEVKRHTSPSSPARKLYRGDLISSSSYLSSSLLHLPRDRGEQKRRERRAEVEVKKKMQMFREKKKKKERSKARYEGDEEIQGSIIRDFLKALQTGPGSAGETRSDMFHESSRGKTKEEEEEKEGQHSKEDTYDLLASYNEQRRGDRCMYSAGGLKGEKRIRNAHEASEGKEDLFTASHSSSFFFSPSAVSPTVSASVALLDLLSRSEESSSSSSTDVCTASFFLGQRKDKKKTFDRTALCFSSTSPPREREEKREEEEREGERWGGEMLNVYMQKVLLPSLREKRREVEIEFICEVFDQTKVLEAIIVIRAVALLQMKREMSNLFFLLFSRLDAPLAHIDPVHLNSTLRDVFFSSSSLSSSSSFTFAREKKCLSLPTTQSKEREKNEKEEKEGRQKAFSSSSWARALEGDRRRRRSSEENKSRKQKEEIPDMSKRRRRRRMERREEESGSRSLEVMTREILTPLLSFCQPKKTRENEKEKKKKKKSRERSVSLLGRLFSSDRIEHVSRNISFSLQKGNPLLLPSSSSASSSLSNEDKAKKSGYLSASEEEEESKELKEEKERRMSEKYKIQTSYLNRLAFSYLTLQYGSSGTSGVYIHPTRIGGELTTTLDSFLSPHLQLVNPEILSMYSAIFAFLLELERSLSLLLSLPRAFPDIFTWRRPSLSSSFASSANSLSPLYRRLGSLSLKLRFELLHILTAYQRHVSLCCSFSSSTPPLLKLFLHFLLQRERQPYPGVSTSLGRRGLVSPRLHILGDLHALHLLFLLSLLLIPLTPHAADEATAQASRICTRLSSTCGDLKGLFYSSSSSSWRRRRRREGSFHPSRASSSSSLPASGFSRGNERTRKRRAARDKQEREKLQGGDSGDGEKKEEEVEEEEEDEPSVVSCATSSSSSYYEDTILPWSCIASSSSSSSLNFSLNSVLSSYILTLLQAPLDLHRILQASLHVVSQASEEDGEEKETDKGSTRTTKEGEIEKEEKNKKSQEFFSTRRKEGRRRDRREEEDEEDQEKALRRESSSLHCSHLLPHGDEHLYEVKAPRDSSRFSSSFSSRRERDERPCSTGRRRRGDSRAATPCEESSQNEEEREKRKLQRRTEKQAKLKECIRAVEALHFNVRRSCLCLLAFLHVTTFSSSSSDSSLIEKEFSSIPLSSLVSRRRRRSSPKPDRKSHMKERKREKEDGKEEDRNEAEEDLSLGSSSSSSSFEFLSHAFFQIASECLSASSSSSFRNEEEERRGENDFRVEKTLGVMCEELSCGLRGLLSDLDFNSFYSDLLLQSFTTDLFSSSSPLS
ncbi:spc97 spc98 family [Cystoisospora suis]|uniref:Spc97 spc98 family n=1 Tax=Cystoisospora suis TaxID=483139 RepID=A0A2C6L2F3_9APIC|nr:spc97 spc98 family [Cystoisospora suis]